MAFESHLTARKTTIGSLSMRTTRTIRAFGDRPYRMRYFPIAPELLNSGENPMLILPTNYQLVGAVFVESTPVGSRSEGDLITSMDRQGFLHNDAFEQFVDFVRGDIEFLAKEDRASLQRAAERDAKAAARQTREDFKEAIRFIEDSPAIPKAEKNRAR